MSENNATRDFLLLHLIVILWGFTGVLGKYITLDSSVLLWWRLLFALIPLFLLGLFLTKIKQSLFLHKPSMVIGLVLGLHWLTFFYAIKISNVSVALVALSLGPLFASLIKIIGFKQKSKPSEFVFSILSIVGLYIATNAEINYLSGFLVAIVSAFFGALFTVVNERLVQKHPPVTIATNELFSAFLMATVILFYNADFGSIFSGQMQDYIALLILGVICTSFCFWVSISIMKKISSYTVMLAVNLEPVYGVILALIAFGESEHMNPSFYLGGTILVLTLILERLWDKSKQRKNRLMNLKG